MAKASRTLNYVLHKQSRELHNQLLTDYYGFKLMAIYTQLYNEGYGIYVVDQARGFCTTGKVVAIPLAILHDKGRTTYYIAHEFAHAIVGIHHQHDKVFMDKLIEICPAEYIHMELSYKPSHTLAIGMASKEVLDDLM